MVIKKIVVLGVISLTLLSKSYAQQYGNEIITEFFKNLENNPSLAFDNIFSSNNWFAENRTTVENVKKQYISFVPELGNYIGFEKITEKQVTERFYIVSYFAYYERQPMRIIFILYKPNEKWQLQNLSFDDNYSDELKEYLKMDKR